MDGGTYLFPGVPDGMGWVARDGKVSLFVNHEWPKNAGLAAGPLPSGARISELTLSGGKVVAGRMAIREVWLGEPAEKAEHGQVMPGEQSGCVVPSHEDAVSLVMLTHGNGQALA